MIATAASVVNACQTQTGVATGKIRDKFYSIDSFSFFFYSCIFLFINFFILVDIEAVRNGQWPETRQLKVIMHNKSHESICRYNLTTY